MPDEETDEEIKTIERFEVALQRKLLASFENIFSSDGDISEQEFLEREECSIVDPAHVCLCIAKTDQAKRFLVAFASQDVNPKIPEIHYDKEEKSKSLYSIDYLFNIFKILEITLDYVQITIGTDYPGIFENDDFKFILAPRIEDFYHADNVDSYM